MDLVRSLALAVLLVGCQGWLTLAVAADTAQFNRDIRPILSAKCYQCHGPDEQHREADLRFDQADVDFAAAGIIVPGEPGESELIRRIQSDDAEEIMPPPAAKRELTPVERRLLLQWVEQGGRFQGHWAFLVPQKVLPPAVQELAMAPVRNAVDQFIQRKLREQGLEPSPEADRRTLIRRATLDLWGLPPTPDAIHTFLADRHPEAYERLLDRLFDSPRFGERMTLAWMDAARYGDSSVFHADGPRDMWPWRDWVLKAYNTNLPFDEFTVNQLAGDLLPNPTTDQLVATGFNRNHGTTDEGGAIDEEYRVEYIVDRVKTTSMVWMGLTMECAQCHDHKYDPITQQDYYRFFAFFNQTPEQGMQTRNGNAEPRVMVPSDDQAARLAQLQRDLEQRQAAFEASEPSERELSAWIEQRQTRAAEPQLGSWYRLGPFVAASVDLAFTKNFGPEKQRQIDLDQQHANQSWVAEDAWQDGELINFASSEPQSATYIYRTIEVDEPTVLPVSLGSDDTITLWLDGKELLKKKVNRGAAADQDQIDLELTAGSHQLLMKICNNTGNTGFYFKPGNLTLPPELEEVLQLAASARSPEQFQKLRDHFKSKVWPAGKQQLAEIAAAKQRHDDYSKSVPTVMVMRDMNQSRMTFVLDRGHYASPNKDRPVAPRTPDFLPQFADAGLESRLGLARWLTHADHPLTARVAVNRYWTMLFGRGIVATVADFGSQGAWPSHPELLDYLARDFVESGWDIKRILRKIMTSHTYRQSSKTSELHWERDPLNIYLARAPRQRMPAEFIRDNALSLAGLLVERLGGPGVKPYQPPGLWNEVSLDGNVRFVQDHGDKLYRRTMYTYWKRSSPQPAMMAFDVPTREKCVIQRQVTNTPLQALVTLNDTQYVEAARCFAQRLLEAPAADSAARLDRALEMATGRPADPLRQQLLLELLTSEQARYREDPEAAQSLLSVGEASRNPTLDAAEHAAWTIVTSAILNLDETLNRE